MATFTYNGPPDEPGVGSVENALTGAWIKGVAREVADPRHIAFLRKHPHWSEGEAVAEDSADTDGDGEISAAEARERLDFLGVTYDKRWGVAKLRAALAEAGG
jgi:hypothetical protein